MKAFSLMVGFGFVMMVGFLPNTADARGAHAASVGRSASASSGVSAAGGAHFGVGRSSLGGAGGLRGGGVMKQGDDREDSGDWRIPLLSSTQALGGVLRHRRATAF